MLTPLLEIRPGLTAVIGSGGKTTLLRTLGRELAEAGHRVLLCTTTKIFPFSDIETLISPDEKARVTVLRDGKELEFEVVFKGTAYENGTESSDGSVAFYGSFIRKHDDGVEIVELGPGKLKDAGAVEGFIIQYVNDHPVKTPQDIIDIVKKSKRAVFIEGKTPSGRTGYFGFGV